MSNKQDPKMMYVNDYIVVPQIFHSDATGEPLKNCVMCEEYLCEHGTPYVIEKAFRYNKKFKVRETLFEYAICFKCYEKVSVKLSHDSTTRLESYFRKNAKLNARRDDLIKNKNLSVEDWMEHCAIKGTDIKDCNEYQVCCQCDGPNLLFTNLPMAISEEALMEISEQLSAETKEELDQFKDDFLGLPPELKELFKDKSFVLV